MSWCPKCKCEYEEGIEKCAECHIDLVDSLEEAKYYKPIIKVTKEESTRIVEFLKYSKVEDITMEEDENNKVVISVIEDQAKDAIKYLNVYLYEEAKEDQSENEDDYYVDEYKTEDLSSGEDKVKEMQSSYISFLVVGAIVALFSALNLFGVIDVLSGRTVLIPLLITGLFFVGVGVYTKVKMPAALDETKNVAHQVNEMVAYYEDHYDLSEFYEKHQIKVDQLDEGALYFAAIDIIKKDLVKHYGEESISTVNTAAEEIYNRI